MDGIFTMVNNNRIIYVAALFFLFIAGCGQKIPSDEEVKKIFSQHEAELKNLVNTCRLYPSVMFISAQGDIERAFDSPIAESNETIATQKSRMQLKQLGLINMHCLRDWSVKEIPFEMTKFTVYSRGFAFGGEAKGITYFTDLAAIKYAASLNEGIQKNELYSLEQRGWYIEHMLN